MNKIKKQSYIDTRKCAKCHKVDVSLHSVFVLSDCTTKHLQAPYINTKMLCDLAHMFE